jgi:hypothetical protein
MKFMNFNLKHLAVAIALAGTFSSAQAAVVNLTGADFAYDIGVNPTASNIYSVTHESDSFSDVFLFSLTEFSDAVASAVSLNLPGLNGQSPSYLNTIQKLALFSDPEGDGMAGVNNEILGAVTYGDENGTISVNNLTSGSYYFQVSGLASGAEGGKYLFAANTAPVPEPESYAMMLAGLGLLGFVGKRRMTRSPTHI